MFLNPNIFSNLNCSDFLDMRNLQEQIKKAFCYHKLFWPFTVRVNLSSDLKNFRPSASTFKRFSRSLEQFFLTVGQKNFGNKMIFVIGLFPHIVNLVLFEWPCAVEKQVKKIGSWYEFKCHGFWWFVSTGSFMATCHKVNWHLNKVWRILKPDVALIIFPIYCSYYLLWP